MGQTIQQKQIEYFTRDARSCLERWNSIVGQQITHYRDGLGTVVGITTIDNRIYVEVLLTARQESEKFLGLNLPEFFTHLTFPREIEKELEIRRWNSEKRLDRRRKKLMDKKIGELRDLASQSSIDQSTYNTFNEIYDGLMGADRTGQLSEQDTQKIKEYQQKLTDKYQQKLTDKMICEFRSLVSRPSIDQSTYNTFDEIYDRLMTMNQKRKLPEEIVQEINGYKKKLMDIKRFTNLSEKAMNPNVRAHFSLPELDEDDIQLVGKWDPLLNNLDRTSLIELTENDNKAKWESGRLLSARSAEKIAVCFYRNYEKGVKDISITQIDENNNFDWKDYDLDVDGLHVDIKNSRQSQKSKDRYTEHCIPSFKYSRRTNQEVRIAGVFSPYIWTPELLEPTEHQESDEILFLGETGKKEQQKLKQEFKDLAGFERPNNLSKYFLPPWVFDYPEYVYKERDNALNELKDFPNLALLKEVELEFNLIPVGIAVGIDLTKILDNEALDLWEWKFLDQLRNRIMKYKLSLPFLFLTLLSHFIGMASSSKGVSDFNPDKYRKFLFYKGRSNKPLGVYDPLKTIDALIEALSTLWTADNGLIRKFRVFKLMSFNILQGKSNPNENSWTTLIAYCGGRLQDGSACGKNPLVLGKAKLCEHGKLKCPECNFCCDKCRGERSLTSFPPEL